jgi:large subunit ribosomal protein L22
MISKASVMYVRIAPRKVRYVIDLIRKKKVREAEGILSGSPRRAGEIISKLLAQAVDAAQKNSQVPAENLFISKVTADGGPSMRRFRAASMGRASLIKKRTSHIHLELDMTKAAQAAESAKPAKGAETKKAPAPAKAATGTKKAAAAKKPTKKLVGAK